VSKERRRSWVYDAIKGIRQRLRAIERDLEELKRKVERLDNDLTATWDEVKKLKSEVGGLGARR